MTDTTEVPEVTEPEPKKKEAKDIALKLDPAKVIIIDDKTDVRYDPREAKPVNEEMVLNMIATKRVVVPIIVQRDGKDDAGDWRYVVIEGRQRLKAAREANARFAKSGEDFRLHVTAVVREKLSEYEHFAHSTIANNFRQQDTPLEMAERIELMTRRGIKESDIAHSYGKTVQWVKNALMLLECSTEVRKAVEGGEIPLAIAQKFSKLPKVKQNEKLQVMKDKGQTKGKTGIHKGAAEILGEPVKRPRLARKYAEVVAAVASLEPTDPARLALDWVLGLRESFAYTETVETDDDAEETE